MQIDTTDSSEGVSKGISLKRADGWKVLAIDARSLQHEATKISMWLFAFDYMEPPPNLSVYVDWIRVSDGSAGPWEFAANGNPIIPDVMYSDGQPVVDWRGP